MFDTITELFDLGTNPISRYGSPREEALVVIRSLCRRSIPYFHWNTLSVAAAAKATVQPPTMDIPARLQVGWWCKERAMIKRNKKCSGTFGEILNTMSKVGRRLHESRQSNAVFARNQELREHRSVPEQG